MARADSWATDRIAAQCIIPKLEIERYNTDDGYKANIRNLAEAGIGGFCIFGGGPDSVEIVTEELQAISTTPLIFCADLEFGLPMRLSEGTAFPHAMALGKAGDPKITYDSAKSIALEARSIGIHWNLAPVCDVNSNRKNPIINIRSFGEDAKLVSSHALAYIEGTKAEKVLSCAKHFPGHGDTHLDSHLDLPVIDRPVNLLEDSELVPFKDAIAEGVDSIMIGHLAVTAYDEITIPASLSRKIVTGILREQLGYKGIAITDALDMTPIKQQFISSEAVIRAFLAGNNITLMPVDPIDALKGVIEKANEDASFRWHLQNSANLLLEKKRQCGLIPQYAKPQKSPQTFMQHTKSALRYAYQAIEVEGDKSLLPLKEEKQIAGFAFLQTDADLQSGSRFYTMLSQAIENDADFGFIDSSVTDSQIEDFLDKIEGAELLIFPIFFKSVAYHGSVELSEKLTKSIKKLAAGRKHIIIFLGNPYLSDVVSGDLNIFTYSDSFASLAAAIVKLTGREQALSV